MFPIGRSHLYVKRRLMTGNEALRMYDQLKDVYNLLLEGREREAFYYLGNLNQELAMIIKISENSFNNDEM